MKKYLFLFVLLVAICWLCNLVYYFFFQSDQLTLSHIMTWESFVFALLATGAIYFVNRGKK